MPRSTGVGRKTGFSVVELDGRYGVPRAPALVFYSTDCVVPVCTNLETPGSPFRRCNDSAIPSSEEILPPFRAVSIQKELSR